MWLHRQRIPILPSLPSPSISYRHSCKPYAGGSVLPGMAGWAEQRVDAAGSGSVWAKHACRQKSWLGSGMAGEVEPHHERDFPCHGPKGRDNAKDKFMRRPQLWLHRQRIPILPSLPSPTISYRHSCVPYAGGGVLPGLARLGGTKGGRSRLRQRVGETHLSAEVLAWQRHGG